MSLLERPLLVVSDLHLSTGSRSGAVANDLTRLLGEHPGHELVLDGDIFNLSVDAPGADPERSAVALLRAHRDLVAALRNHLGSGTPVTLVAGNHDAPLMTDAAAAALRGAVEVADDAPLTTRPWFLRRGPVHVEHGHYYDPDNAPTHPLALWTPDTEPLGISLTRRFLSPSGALAFHHAHELTPAEALARAARLFGLRTPLLVARYFQTTAQLCAEAGRQPGLGAERRQGARAEAAFASGASLDPSELDRLLALGPRPTHHDAAAMFMRLYFDRILACVAGAGVGATSALLRSLSGLGVAGLALLYLARSVRSGSRYAGLPQRQLREAASSVVRATAARTVIFGHTHHFESRDLEPGHYINTGSFAYQNRPGRPYARVTETAVGSLRHLPV